jgi:alkyldihydroxyacetonephosphate synthase
MPWVRPHDKDQIERIVSYCAEPRIPITVHGGGSSAMRGLEPFRGGVTLDLWAHFNEGVSFNETNQTITVEAGISGPKLEEALNRAPQNFGAGHRYTCGHFPQSFEYSSVGGWEDSGGYPSDWKGQDIGNTEAQGHCIPRATTRYH